ncbi:MAG: hypothetical protein A2W85_11590 [Bacteroidetes bacterium GWF2_41_31]|nr:MAG: hypothetical protein A2W85_11590 [Bacteroidetes bacterium GWF2_41_31]
MKYLIVKFSIIIAISLVLFTCKIERNCINLNGDLYYKLFVFNEVDTINGYYKIKGDSLFFISLWDLNNYDKLCAEFNSNRDIKPYFLFSLNMDDTYTCKKHACDINSSYGNTDFRDLRNVFYKPKKINDSLFIVKHVSVEYNCKNPFVREFVINSKLEIIELKSIGKNKEYYFFYD